MTPDPEQRLPRELLKELIEEGSDAFRGVLEKLLNTAMQMEREEFLGARRWERSEQRRDHANGYKAKTLSTRVGQLQIRIPQVRHLDFYPRSLERGCRSEKALKLAIAEMYVMGVSTRKVTEITEQLCGTEISAYLAAHSHQQRAGEPKPSDSPAYPGRRYLSKHRVRTTTHHRCRRGDSRRLADRETVPQPGRFQTTGESDLRSLSVKLQKNSCLA